MGRGKQNDTKGQVKALVKKEDFLKKYGSKTHMRLRKNIYGEGEYEKFHQKFRNEYREGVIEDYNSSKNMAGYQKKIYDHVLRIFRYEDS